MITWIQQSRYDARIARYSGKRVWDVSSNIALLADASRAWYSMAKDTLIPNAFAVLHPKYKHRTGRFCSWPLIAIAFGFTGLAGSGDHFFNPFGIDGVYFDCGHDDQIPEDVSKGIH